MASNVTVKQEPVEAVELESRILELCKACPDGISDQAIQSDMPQVNATLRVVAMNRLLKTGKIDLLKRGKQLIYKLKDQSAASKLTGANAQERVVLEIIKAAGNKGIWNRHINYNSKLEPQQLNKILKNLESKKYIKAVKSVAAPKKKIYMLFDETPDESVTGGAFWSDQDFESEFVDVLNRQCYSFLESKAASAKTAQSDPISQRNAAYASSRELQKYITELGISKVQLSINNIETILNTLIYDGKAERTIVPAADGSEEQTKLYRAVGSLISPTGLMRMPCGVCPVISECREGGAISPSTCAYMKEWLEY